MKKLMFNAKKPAISLFLGGFALLLVFQVHQTIEGLRFARIAAVQHWGDEDINNKPAATKYIDICESGIDVIEGRRFTTIVGCQEAIGNGDLVKVVTLAMNDTQPPIPLRWFVNQWIFIDYE